MTPGDPIVFDHPEHNVGGYYNSTTGIYTVPIDGVYEFIFHISAYGDATLGAWLVVDGEDVSVLSTRDCCNLHQHFNKSPVLVTTKNLFKKPDRTSSSKLHLHIVLTFQMKLGSVIIYLL